MRRCKWSSPDLTAVRTNLLLVALGETLIYGVLAFIIIVFPFPDIEWWFKVALAIGLLSIVLWGIVLVVLGTHRHEGEMRRMG